MLDDSLNACGKLNIKLIDHLGNIKQERDETNVVVNDGLRYIAARMFSNSSGTAGTGGVMPATGLPTIMTHMAIGTSTTAEQKSDSALFGEVARVALDSTTIAQTTISDDSVQYVATFNPGVGTAAITEAGIFNASTSGKMLCRTTFSVINKGALDTLVITWKVTVA